MIVRICLLWALFQALTPQAAEETAEHLRRTVETLCREGRAFPDTDALDRCAAWLQSELEACGWSVEEHAYRVEGRTVRNLYAYHGRPDGPLTVIGAHYDTAEGTPGADDNASGVAVVLELARLTAAEERTPRANLCLAFYTLEEPQLRVGTENMGSRKHAEALRAADAEVELMAALEMVGFFSSAENSQRYPSRELAELYPDRGDFLAILSDAPSLPQAAGLRDWLAGRLSFPVLAAPAPPGFDDWAFSDHYPFWLADYRAIVITDTAWLRNPHYHRAADTPDTLDYGRMAELARALAERYSMEKETAAAE